MRRHVMPPHTFAIVVAITTLSLIAAGCGGGELAWEWRASAFFHWSRTRTAHPAGQLSEQCSTDRRDGALRQHGLTSLPDPAVANPRDQRKAKQLSTSRPFLRAVPGLVGDERHGRMPDRIAERPASAAVRVREPRRKFKMGSPFPVVRAHGVSNFPDPNGQGSSCR